MFNNQKGRKRPVPTTVTRSKRVKNVERASEQTAEVVANSGWEEGEASGRRKPGRPKREQTKVEPILIKRVGKKLSASTVTEARNREIRKTTNNGDRIDADPDDGNAKGTTVERKRKPNTAAGRGRARRARGNDRDQPQIDSVAETGPAKTTNSNAEEEPATSMPVPNESDDGEEVPNEQESKTDKLRDKEDLKETATSPLADLLATGTSGKYPMTEPWLKAASQSMSKEALTAMRSSEKLIGGHISSKGGLHKVPMHAAAVGCRAFAVFLRSNFSWKLSKLDDKVVQKFLEACHEYGYSRNQILPHGSYLLNPGSTKDDTYQKSKETLLFEARLCERLGLKLYVFHPGSTLGVLSVADCCKRIAEVVNWVISETSSVIILLETMAGQGNTVGGKFEEIKMIIDEVADKSRIGVCLDTCHIFAAGYDIRKPEEYSKVMDRFDSIIGFGYLKGVHLNDSKGECGCHMDRHELIGKGHLGMQAFQNLLKDARFDNIPMILETPAESYDREIQLLYEEIQTQH